jgi:hypothetical protein
MVPQPAPLPVSSVSSAAEQHHSTTSDASPAIYVCAYAMRAHFEVRRACGLLWSGDRARGCCVRLQPGMRLHARSHTAQGRWRGGGGVRRGAADLRCDSGGVLQELDDLHAVFRLGVVQRRPAILRRGGKREEVEAAALGGRGRERGLRGAERRRGACEQVPTPPTPAPPLAPNPPRPLLGPLRHHSPRS